MNDDFSKESSPQLKPLDQVSDKWVTLDGARLTRTGSINSGNGTYEWTPKIGVKNKTQGQFNSYNGTLIVCDKGGVFHARRSSVDVEHALVRGGYKQTTLMVPDLSSGREFFADPRLQQAFENTGVDTADYHETPRPPSARPERSNVAEATEDVSLEDRISTWAVVEAQNIKKFDPAQDRWNMGSEDYYGIMLYNAIKAIAERMGNNPAEAKSIAKGSAPHDQIRLAVAKSIKILHGDDVSKVKPRGFLE
jgi:hypothetical protein